MSFIVPVLAFALTILAVPVVIKFANKYGYVARPSKSRWHTRSTALMGGIAIFLSFFITILIVLSFSRHWNVTTIVVLFGAWMMFVIGLRDDIQPFTPKVKLGAQLLVAVMTIIVGIHFNTGLGIWLDIPISIIWIAGVINALNLIDNMDGLSSGIAFIASSFIAVLGMLSNHSFLSLTALTMAGGCLGFLLFNFKPAKIFMGDCGSLFLGYMLAVLTMMLQSVLDLESSLIGSFYLAAFILAVPLFDTFLVMFDRKRHGRSIAQGGKDHTSHRLVYLTGSERKAVMILYGLGLFYGGLGLIGHYFSDLIKYTFIAFGLFIVLLLSYILIRFVPVYDTVSARKDHATKREVASTKKAMRQG